MTESERTRAGERWKTRNNSYGISNRKRETTVNKNTIKQNFNAHCACCSLLERTNRKKHRRHINFPDPHTQTLTKTH